MEVSMTTRKLYSEELVQLSESLEEMGNLVEASLKNLFFSIENKDMQSGSWPMTAMSTTWSAASKLSA
jgi:phosphate uptake regulator